MLLLLLACTSPKGTDDTGSDTGDSASDTGDTAPDPTSVGVTLRRTAHGVVHVTAADTWGLAYGVGYAYTEDNRCLLARRIAEVDGRLAAALGAEADVYIPVHGLTWSALDSDRMWRSWLDDEAIAAAMDAGSPEARAAAEGYAAGITRFLVEHPELAECEVPFPDALTSRHVYRMWVATTEIASGELLGPYLASEPPTARAAVRTSPPWPARLAGSNAWALGRDAVPGGGAVHLYNPHFPWQGIHRVYQVHLTIPGDMDVSGVALGGFPFPAAGFNEHVAWGLTFSNAGRFTVAELALTDGDPMHYVVDGATRAITEEHVSIDVLGESTPRDVSFYRAEDGPVLDTAAFLMGWDTTHAYAIHDVNADNTRFVEQLIGLARAADVEEVRASLAAVQGLPWSYVSAADDAGSVLFAELSNVPAVSTELIEGCAVANSDRLAAYGIYLLDGTRAACAWEGRMSPDQLPWTIRADYVANSNNTHELPNLAERLTGYSAILGVEGAPLALRPTMGLTMIEDRLSGADGLGEPGFSLELARAVFGEARGLAGERLASAIAADCLASPITTYSGDEVDLTAACTVLAAWDGGYRTDSVGALLFSGLWVALGSQTGALWAVPPDPADPIGTPSGYTADGDVRATVRSALAQVVVTLGEAGIALDTPWGEVHAIVGPEGAVGVPGGAGAQGVFDVLEGTEEYGSWRGWQGSLGGTAPEDLFGASYLHAVELGPDGPRAQTLLTYSQATEPDSPWYLDQLDPYGRGEWMDVPWREADIAADPELHLTEL